MEKQLLYEGKAKRIYTYPEDDRYFIQEFKDDATAFNGLKKEQIKNKGVINNNISSALFEYLKKNGIDTHFKKQLSDTEMLVKKVEIVKVEVVCRNIAAGSFVKKFGFTEGTELKKPIIEYYYKSDEAGDPLFTKQHILALGLADEKELKRIKKLTLKINELLKSFFLKRKIKLVDFKLEFGRDSEGKIILADEISPDTCRFWDSETNKKLDKDRFRFDLGDVEGAYEEMLGRITNGKSVKE